MISRRLIRIKIAQVLYAHLTDDNSTLEKSEKELTQSIKKAYDLYHYLLLLILNVVDYAEERIELARNKNLPTYDDIHPNTRFIDNKLISQLRNCNQLNLYISSCKLSWAEHPEIIKKLYYKILEASYYKEYMALPNIDYESDKKLILDIFTNELENWDFFYQLIEEQSIYWNDDIEFVIGMILQTIEKFKESNPSPGLMPLYKNDDDKEFAKVLLRKTILGQSEYRQLIDNYTKNWEVERIAIMDVLIMLIAITEIMEFPGIPIKVTLNEYIDIARYYSTSKSNEFVNGVLDKIVNDLRRDNKITKTGRGLMGDAGTES